MKKKAFVTIGIWVLLVGFLVVCARLITFESKDLQTIFAFCIGGVGGWIAMNASLLVWQ